MSAATNSTGEYLALHRLIEAEGETAPLTAQDVSLEVLWQDVQCARHALIVAREQLEKASRRVMSATEAWMAAAKHASPVPALSQSAPLRAV